VRAEEAADEEEDAVAEVAVVEEATERRETDLPRRRNPSPKASREKESPETEAQDLPVRTEMTSQRAKEPRDHPDTTRTEERVARDPSASTMTEITTRSLRDPPPRETTSPEATEEVEAEEVEEAEVKAVEEREEEVATTSTLPRLSEQSRLSDRAFKVQV